MLNWKQELALDILKQLAQGDISSKEKPEFTIAGNDTMPLLLRSLATHGAIDSDAKAGRYGSTTHSITDEGRRLLGWLESGDINKKLEGRDHVRFKWQLVLYAYPATLRSSSQRINDVERAGIYFVWRGWSKFADIINEIGSREAKALLYLTDAIRQFGEEPLDCDIRLPNSGFDASDDIYKFFIKDKVDLAKTEVQRIGMYLFAFLIELQMERDYEA